MCDFILARASIGGGHYKSVIRELVHTVVWMERMQVCKMVVSFSLFRLRFHLHIKSLLWFGNI